MLPVNDEIKDLRKLLSSYTGVPEKSMLITEITNEGFQRTFSGTCAFAISVLIYDFCQRVRVDVRV